ncbi:MAG: MaoC family dehydratase N-terminal domain-containing protein [Rhizobacter sp.]|nr:MaoC family dehydratase N-terminal domain-containing protein [Rhizobacter sp.]
MPAAPLDPHLRLASLRDWIGRTEQHHDLLGAAPMAALAATLDRDDPAPSAGSELPPLWHWVYFGSHVRQHELDEDGHARRGGFTPPVPLPRRMWAGGQLQFHQPLRIGDAVSRLSRIADVKVKQGRSGTLVFVTIEHEFSTERGLALTEAHDIVYREAPHPDAPAPPAQAAPADEAWAREIVPGPVLLFRYSALTFNAHRIHYDRPYATEVEGYPGLVVHGPLIATLLLDLLRREQPRARVLGFRYQALRPLFDTQRFSVCGRPEADGRRVTLWARDARGLLAMQGEAHIDEAAHRTP